jgi:trehalose 6-phosphate phosphatase
MTKTSHNHSSPAAGVPSALEYVDDIVASHGRRLAVFLDYDGTLTPIVSQPEQAVFSDSARRTLRSLAVCVPVAVLSGRDLEDIRQRVGIDEIVYAGSHGFDITGPRGLRKEVATEFLSILSTMEKELGKKLAGIPGAFVERKRFSIAAHFRQADASGAAKVKQAVDQTATRHPELRKIDGKKVCELQPNVGWHKGKALIWLLGTLNLKQSEVLPIYIGDDLTDEDVFRALRQRGIGVVVSRKPRRTAARYALKSPAEVARFLQELAFRLPTADS